MNELEKCYCSISFLKPATKWSIIYDFYLNGHVIYQAVFKNNIYTIKCEGR